MDYLEILLLLLKCAALLACFFLTVALFNRHKSKTDSRIAQQNSLDSITKLESPKLSIRFQSARNIRFNWQDVSGASHYQLLERIDDQYNFKLVGSYILPGRESLTWTTPLHSRINAHYILRAYNEEGFSDSALISVSRELEDNLRFLRASEIESSEFFGFVVSLSQGDNTLIIAEDDFNSAHPRVQGTKPSNYLGAAFVFHRINAGQWSQTAYINALAKADIHHYDLDQTDGSSIQDTVAASTETAQSEPATKRDLPTPELFFR